MLKCIVGKTKAMKKIINIIIGGNGIDVLYKDPGSILYTLAKDYGWHATFMYLLGKEGPISCSTFEEFAHICCGGDDGDTYDSRKHVVKNFIHNHIKEYDVVYFMGYGNTLYKMAYLCKKYNPLIKVYVKMDMNQNGFNHFNEVSLLRKIKNRIERFKSRYIDYFSVENPTYYKLLKKTAMFKNRLLYIPNGVGTMDVDISKIDQLIKKENIISIASRFGNYDKNTEFFIDAICCIPKEIISKWKIYLLGPQNDSFKLFLQEKIEKYPWISDSIKSFGLVTNRQQLYEFYAMSKIFCMTSRTESFCIAAAEASYFGAIPILTNFGESVSLITDNKSFGAVIEQNDIDGYVNTLEKFMQINDDDAAVLFRKIQLYARKNYDYKTILNEFVERFS